MNTNTNLKIAIVASIKASQEIIKVYNGDIAIEKKADNSPLTLADKNANFVINTYLESTGIPVISEENAQISYDVRKDWKECWIVDPLDGTKEFIKKNGEFTVNIALVKKGQPILGVVYAPDTKELYYADVLKMKAYKLILASENISIEEIFKAAILIGNNKKQDKILKIVGSRSHMNQRTIDFVEEFTKKAKNVEVISKGSSLKFCLVAEGSADIYPRFASTMEWDTAAAHAVCSASGVKVYSEETGKELVYNKQNLLNPWFICKR